MAAVAGRRERGGHQRSNSNPVVSSTTGSATATRNTNRNFSTSSTQATPTASASLTTPQHHRLLSKSSITSTSSTDAAAAPQPNSARRRLTATKRHSSSLSQSQSVPVSPLVPNNSVSGRQDSSTTVSAVNSPVIPSKRHSAPSADPTTTRSRPSAANPLHQRSVSSSSSSPVPTRHSRKPSDGPSVTTSRGPDSATTRTSRTSTLGSSRTSRTSTAASASPARAPVKARTTASSPARTPAARSSASASAAAKPQPPISKSTTHRRAETASLPSGRSSRSSRASATTSPIPPTPAPPVPSTSAPPSAPLPPEATSAGIPPQIQAELDKNASVQITQPPRRAKAPARFSSNGIATADAPPPSLAYRQLPLTAAPPPPPAIPPPPPAPQPPPPRPSVEDEVEDFQYPPPIEEDRSSSGSGGSNSKALITIEVDDKYVSPPVQQQEETMTTTYESDQFSRSNGYAGKYNATVEDDEPTIRDIQRVVQEERSFANSPNPLTSSRSASTPSQNGDDPFLSLARSSTPRSQALLDAQARQERRRSRMMQYSVNSGRTSNLSHEYSSTVASSRAPKSTTASTIVSDDSFGGVELSQDAPYQTPGDPSSEADHSLNHRSSFLRRQRESQNGHSRSVSEAPPRTTLTRANGVSSELPSGAPRPSQSVLRSPISTLIESDRAKNAAQARLGINDDAQSTISSGTVWDELDELKMRIKRLELTGTLPPASSSLSGVGSGISNSSGDRPRTGTTAATTVSSSPRQKSQQINSNTAAAAAAAAAASAAVVEEPTANGPPPTIHPVLHAALAKTKTVLPEHIIKALDALANDTLNLAQAVGSTGQSAMSINAALNSPEKQLITDRQIRRKVDNVCRSLTELCISLADGRMPFEPPPDNQVQTMPVAPPPQIQQPQIEQPPHQQQQQQQHQQQQQQQVQTTVFPPRVEDPIERSNTAFDYRSPSAIGHKIDREATVTPNSAARAHARFEARRASLLGAPSPQYISRQEASPSPQPGNRLSHRNSMSLRSGQRSSFIEPEDEIDPQAPTYRSPSRASNFNSTSHLSPLRTTFTGGQSFESSPMQRTLTLREQRAAQQAQQQALLQAQANLDFANSGFLSTTSLQHRRNYSTATTVTPTNTQSTGLGLTTQRRSYLDRERGIPSDNVIGTALTTGTGIGSASQPIDISRRRTEYLRAANGGDQLQQLQQQQDMSYSPPQSVNGSSMGGRSRAASVSSRVGSVRTRTTNMLGSNYAASGASRVDTGLGLGRDRVTSLNTTRR